MTREPPTHDGWSVWNREPFHALMLAAWDLMGSFLVAGLACLVAYGLARLLLGLLGLIASSAAEGWRRELLEEVVP